jgi:hypothetical protein
LRPEPSLTIVSANQLAGIEPFAADADVFLPAWMAIEYAGLRLRNFRNPVLPMALIQLSSPVTHKTLLHGITEAKLSGMPRETYAIYLEDGCFFSCSGLSLLAAWGQSLVASGNKIKIQGDEDTCRYLARMNLFKILNIPYEEDFVRRVETGRFIPLHKAVEMSDCLELIRRIGDMVLQQFDNAREFFPAIEWAVNEVMDNIIIHSETTVPGVVCAQYRPEMKRLEIGICDMGRGILDSLSERYQLVSHGEALLKALERGVTRDPEVGQGNGLAGTLEIAKANGGTFQLWSGDASFKVSKEDEAIVETIPPTPGTGIFLNLDTTRSVDLKTDTFIGSYTFGDNESTYIFSESERVVSGKGLLIKDECFHTGSRASARALRRKIAALLPDIDGGPILLNFEGVTSASSSFLDELLARLAAEMGISIFKQKIKIINATDTIQRMANVVTKQRLDEAASQAVRDTDEKLP